MSDSLRPLINKIRDGINDLGQFVLVTRSSPALSDAVNNRVVSIGQDIIHLKTCLRQVIDRRVPVNPDELGELLRDIIFGMFGLYSSSFSQRMPGWFFFVNINVINELLDPATGALFQLVFRADHGLQIRFKDTDLLLPSLPESLQKSLSSSDSCAQDPQLLSMLWKQQKRFRSTNIAFNLRQLYIFALISYGSTVTPVIRSSFGLDAADIASNFERRFSTIFHSHAQYFIDFSRLIKESGTPGRLAPTTLDAFEFFCVASEFWMNRYQFSSPGVAKGFEKPSKFELFLLQNLFTVLQSQLVGADGPAHAVKLSVNFELEFSRQLFVFINNWISKLPSESNSDLGPVLNLWLSWLLPTFYENILSDISVKVDQKSDDMLVVLEPVIPSSFSSEDAVIEFKVDHNKFKGFDINKFALDSFPFFAILMDEYLFRLARPGNFSSNDSQLKPIALLTSLLSYGPIKDSISKHRSDFAAATASKNLQSRLTAFCSNTNAASQLKSFDNESLCRAVAKVVALLESLNSASKFPQQISKNLKSLYQVKDEAVLASAKQIRQDVEVSSAGIAPAKNHNKADLELRKRIEAAATRANPWQVPSREWELEFMLPILFAASNSCNRGLVELRRRVSQFAQSNSAHQPPSLLQNASLELLKRWPESAPNSRGLINLRPLASIVVLWWSALAVLILALLFK